MSKQTKPFIPVCEPHFIGKEKHYVNEAVSSGWVSSAGKYINGFEEQFSAYCGRKHGITTTNGTTALHLALIALDIKEGDEVIIPNFAMAAVLKSVLYCRAIPKFVDAEPDTWNIDSTKIAEKITDKTKAIIIVHTYGHPVDVDPILELAKSKNIAVIEDAAEAHGAEYRSKKCGSFGALSCFSFFGNKIITTGEGGMVLTDDSQLAERCRYFKNLCFPLQGKRDYIHNDLGFNYRMTNLQAAVGLAQTECLDQLAELRRKNARTYNGRLQGVPGLQLPVEKDYAKNVYWMYGLVIDEKKCGLSRDTLMSLLKENGIDTRNFFRPLHNQKLLKQFGIEDTGSYPETAWLSEKGFYLPSGSGLKEDDIDYICENLIRLVTTQA
jgi:perosamine synthetase